MQLKQALVFSSLRTAKTLYNNYQILVSIQEREYIPLFRLNDTKCTYDLYILTIARNVDEAWQEPHVEVEDTKERLFTWLEENNVIPTDFADWIPLEPTL